jgi:hypothetical protein
MHEISKTALATSHYCYPRDSLQPYFLWEHFYPMIIAHQEGIAQEFASFMRDLGLAPCPLPGEWVNLFESADVATGFYDATSEMRAYFKTLGGTSKADPSRRGVQVSHPRDWLQLLYIQATKVAKPPPGNVEPPFLLARVFVQSSELPKLRALTPAVIASTHGTIVGRPRNEQASWDKALVLSYEFVANLHEYIADSATEMKVRLGDFGREVLHHLESHLVE